MTDFNNQPIQFMISFVVIKSIEFNDHLLLIHFRHDLVPIVMGARPEDYQRAAPYKSYIHVDDFEGPKELAEFLKKLEENDDMYNEYFRWKVGDTE